MHSQTLEVPEADMFVHIEAQEPGAATAVALVETALEETVWQHLFAGDASAAANASTPSATAALSPYAPQVAPDDADAAAGITAAPALVIQPSASEVAQSTACGAAQSAHDDHYAVSSADNVAAPTLTFMGLPQQPVIISPAATGRVAAAAAIGESRAQGRGWMRPSRPGLVGGCVTVCAAVLAVAGALHSRGR